MPTLTRAATALTTALVVALTATLTLGAGAAQARVAENVVTKGEYDRTSYYMARSRVHTIFGTSGRVVDSAPLAYHVQGGASPEQSVVVGPRETRRYPGACGGVVVMDYMLTATGWVVTARDGFFPAC